MPHDYACVRVDSRGCRLLARLHRSFLAARDQGFLRLHRMGRRAAVVERQGRAQRHLLLRHQPVARRLAAAAASRRDVHLGRRGRLVPRHDAPRRHPLDVLGELVRHAGQDRAVRRRRARQAQPRARRAGVRAGDLSEDELAKNRGDFGADILAHPLDDDYHKARSPIWAKVDHAAVLGRQLGRPGPASARQFRRLRARRVEAEMAGGARHRALDAFLYRLRPRAAAARSSTISCTARRTAGTSSRRCCCRSAIPAKNSSQRAENEWPIKRTQWTKFYLDPASMTLGTKKPSERGAS